MPFFLQMSLPKPDAIMAIYPALLCSMQPSPSRLVCLIDPLVMFPSLLRCLNCYADPDYAKSCPRTYEEGNQHLQKVTVDNGIFVMVSHSHSTETNRLK